MNRIRAAARAVLDWMAGLDHGEGAVGDLEEEYAARKRIDGEGPRAELWYLREAASLMVGLSVERIREWMCARRSSLVGSDERGTDGASNGRWRMGKGTMRWAGALTGVGEELRAAARGLRRRPRGSILIVLTLAVAVGGVSAVSSLVHAAWLRPLPWSDDEALARVFTGYRADGGDTNRTAVAPEVFRTVIADAPFFRDAGAWTIGETVHLTGGGDARRLIAPRITSTLFPMLGVEPEVGRGFRAADEAVGAAPVVLLSRSFWTSAFGADPGILDRVVELDGIAHRVIGVMPDQPAPVGADLWRPLALGPEWFTDSRLGWEMLDVVARLVPGASDSSARDLLHRRLTARSPDRVDRLGQTVVVSPLREEILGSTGPALLGLLAAAVLVLMVASANVATLVAARFHERARELALRRSLGAPGGALARLVLAETAMNAVAGGLLGLLAAGVTLEWLSGARPDLLGPLLPLGISMPVVLLTMGTLGAVVLFVSLGPALRARGLDTGVLMREGNIKGHAGPSTGATRQALVVVEIALALTLLVGVGASLRAVDSLTRADPGFRPDGLLTVALEMPGGGSRAEWIALYQQILERTESLPGVESAGLTYALPLTGTAWSGSFGIVDPDPDQVDMEPGANMRPVSVDYFRTAEMTVVVGRGFTPDDDANTLPVAVVDETVAARFWPGRSPVGERIRLGQLATHDTAVVVGVVADVRDQGLHVSGSGHVYFPLAHSPQRAMTLVLRAPQASTELAANVRDAVRQVDDRIPVVSVTPATTLLQEAMAGPELGTLVLTGFGSVAALLAALGIFGIVGWTVHRRTPEIGTRVALGASRADVVSLVLGQTVRLWVVGAALGLAGGVLTQEALSRVFPGGAPLEPGIVVAAALVMSGLALLAALAPMVRALSVDAVEALRES